MDILSYLSQRSFATVAELAEHFQVSHPTIKRDISWVRHYGADIVSDRQHGYRLMNWDTIKGTVRRWRKLENDRNALHERGL